MKTVSNVGTTIKPSTPTYSAGQWVVTAGGTVDKAQKVVKLLGSLPLSVVVTTDDGKGPCWNPDGSVVFAGYHTEETYGPILRLATPEEIKAGKVMGAGDRMLAADTRRALFLPVSDGTHLEINVGQSQPLSAEQVKTIKSLHRTGHRPHGWAGSTLVTIGGKERQIRTVPRSQMMGLLAHALEDLRAAKRRSDGLNGQLFDLEQKHREYMEEAEAEIKRLAHQRSAHESTFDALSAILTDRDEPNIITTNPGLLDRASGVVVARDALIARSRHWKNGWWFAGIVDAACLAAGFGIHALGRVLGWW